MKRGRGRPRLSESSETKMSVWRITKSDYEAFKEICRRNKIKVSEMLRELVINWYVEKLIEETPREELIELIKGVNKEK